jgi:predicted RNA-binding protein
MRNIKLQNGYRELLGRYENHFEYAVTLTLKKSITITTTNEFGYVTKKRSWLSKTKLCNTTRHFTATLTRYLFGNAAKNKSTRDTARPLLLFVVEGQNSDKRVHLHVALGNVPKHKKADIAQTIKDAWATCDFAYEQVDVKSIYYATGWTNYITKEIGIVNDDALDVVNSVIPKNILNQQL